ncbi:MAG TPA: hypothetical protein VEV45_17260 [Streptosporangiaceae bacterium]|nr:hypothetical protein [Streptosporangiaceae bacterium]
MDRYLGEHSLPQLTDDEFAAERAKAREYSVCILKAGPKFERPDPEFRSEVSQIIWQHGRRNVALHKSGLMPVVCPISDGSGTTGICIFNLPPEEAARVMDHDPGVQAGVFTYEVHPCRSFPGSTLPEP